MKQLEVCIVGSGFAGIAMGIQLKNRGIENFVMLERGAELGGTWRDNNYPGAACDVPSHLYSFSFEPKHDWSRKFAPQAEIWDYQQHCANKYGLLPHIQLNSEVASAQYDDANGLWVVTLTNGEQLAAKHFVSAVGMLSQPAVPAISGAENFAGPRFHSSNWQHDLDIRGKKVAVIGTGASAIQFVPELIKDAAELTLFQRTAPWVMPKPDRAYSAKEQQRFAKHPWLQTLSRLWQYWANEYRVIGMRYFKQALLAYEWNAKRYIRTQIKDPLKRQQVTPSFPMGCKRILVANNYYSALAQNNVSINGDGVDHIESDAIVTNTGQRIEADVLIYGTGFQATNFLTPMQIIGPGGLDLNQVWRNGAEAYYGTTLAGFPNFSMLYGPNVSLGHSSMILMLEAQASYVGQLIKSTLENDQQMSVKITAQDRYNQHIHKELDKTIWAADCNSWYKDENGKNSTSWPGFTFTFIRKLRRFEHSDYEAL